MISNSKKYNSIINNQPKTKPLNSRARNFILGGSLITVPPINETVLEGQAAKLKCVSKMFNALITWYKDNVPINEINDFKDRIHVLSEGSLNILNTKMKDSGYYSCEISNESGAKQAAGAYLNVQCKLKINKLE